MNVIDLLKGRKVNVITNVGTVAELTIKDIKTNIQVEDLEPSTRENDWWPRQTQTISYTVFFNTGYVQTYSTLDSINLVE